MWDISKWLDNNEKNSFGVIYDLCYQGKKDRYKFIGRIRVYMSLILFQIYHRKIRTYAKVKENSPRPITQTN